MNYYVHLLVLTKLGKLHFHPPIGELVYYRGDQRYTNRKTEKSKGNYTFKCYIQAQKLDIFANKRSIFSKVQNFNLQREKGKGAIIFWVVHQMDFGLNSLLQYLYRVLQVAFFHSAVYSRMKHFWHRLYAVGYIEFLDAPHLYESVTH